jgi:hypothetical protein
MALLPTGRLLGSEVHGLIQVRGVRPMTKLFLKGASSLQVALGCCCRRWWHRHHPDDDISIGIEFMPGAAPRWSIIRMNAMTPSN